MVEELCEGGDDEVLFSDVIRELQKRFELYKMLREQLFYVSSDAVLSKGGNSKLEWEVIEERLRIFKLCKEVFHSKSHKDKKTVKEMQKETVTEIISGREVEREVEKEVEVEREEIKLNIKHMKSLLYELRMKINIIMANDYVWVPEDVVENANKIRQQESQGRSMHDTLEDEDEGKEMEPLLKVTDRQEYWRVTKVLTEDFSFIKDKY